MFASNSRYYNLKSIEVVTREGRTVRAVALRRLPEVAGRETVVRDHDRLDILAQRQYDDPTRFWHIADADSELQAGDLVTQAGRVIKVPQQ